MRLTGKQLVEAHRSACTFREFEEHVHMAFATRPVLGFVHPRASTHRGHGHSIEEGAKS